MINYTVQNKNALTDPLAESNSAVIGSRSSAAFAADNSPAATEMDGGSAAMVGMHAPLFETDYR